MVQKQPEIEPLKDAMRTAFRSLRYTTLVPYFLAWKLDAATFIKLYKQEDFQGPSTLRPLVVDALKQRYPVGCFGSCISYAEHLQKKYPEVQLWATSNHCIGVVGDKDCGRTFLAE